MSGLSNSIENFLKELLKEEGVLLNLVEMILQLGLTVLLLK